MLWAIKNIFYSYSAGIEFRRENLDVYRRQILMTKVDPRTVRVKEAQQMNRRAYSHVLGIQFNLS